MSALLATRRRKIAAITTVLVLAAGVAVAAWLISGMGQGRGKIGSLRTLTVSPGATFTSDGVCYPGQTCDAHVLVNNPNGQLKVVSASEGDNTGSGGGCDSYVTVNTVSGLNVPLPPGDSQLVIPGAYSLSADTPSSCQDADFSKSIRVTASTP